MPGASAVSLRGIGPVLVGMTVSQASKAAAVALVADGLPDPDSECGFVHPKGGRPKGLSFMVTGASDEEGEAGQTDRIARVDVDSTVFKTRSGMGVGNTEAEVKAAYPDRIKVEPHKYVDEGHYLVYQPQDAADARFGLVFETDGTKVTSFRAGRQPEVGWVEGCS